MLGYQYSRNDGWRHEPGSDPIDLVAFRITHYAGEPIISVEPQ